jgi:hypothetical protein
MVNTINNTDGSGFEKLSEYLSEIAKHISNTPAIMR